MVPALEGRALHFLPLELYAWKAIYGKNASRDGVTTGLAGMPSDSLMRTSAVSCTVAPKLQNGLQITSGGCLGVGWGKQARRLWFPEPM